MRELTGTEGRLRYAGPSENPYVDDGSRIDIYVDDKGHEYWVDPADGRLVQVGPSADRHQKAFAHRPSGGLTVHDLRRRALALITGQRPEFPSLQSSLHPLEDNHRKRIYYFRWDDLCAPSRESEMPPFIQVGLWFDGELASYTDTLRSR